MSASQTLFSLSRSSLDKILIDVIPRLLPEIREHSIALCNPKVSVPFDFFPGCFFAIDCTFVRHPPPSGLSFQQMKRFYSVKHGAYGYKCLAVVISSGQCIFISDMYPAGVHDFTICTDQKVLPKIQEICGSSFVLCDKGFSGIHVHLRAIIPTRGRPSESSLAETEHNLKIAKSRVLVENFFGRLKVVWSVFLGNSNIHIQHLNERFQLAVYLTNYHIQLNPLRKRTHEIEAALDENMADVAEMDT
jgi:hypothetical protein